MRLRGCRLLNTSLTPLPFSSLVVHHHYSGLSFSQDNHRSYHGYLERLPADSPNENRGAPTSVHQAQRTTVATGHIEAAPLDWTTGSPAWIRLRCRRPHCCAGFGRQACGLLGCVQLFSTAYRAAGHSCHLRQRFAGLCLCFGYHHLLVVKRACWQYTPETSRLAVTR
jgi:hypothetical protein